MTETTPRLDWSQVEPSRRRAAYAFAQPKLPGLRELWEALMRGETVLVAYPYDNMPPRERSDFQSLMASRVTDLRKKGFQPRTRKEDDGIIMWADRI